VVPRTTVAASAIRECLPDRTCGRLGVGPLVGFIAYLRCGSVAAEAEELRVNVIIPRRPDH